MAQEQQGADLATIADLAAIMELLMVLSDYVLDLPDGFLLSGKRVRAAQDVVRRRLGSRRKGAQ